MRRLILATTCVLVAIGLLVPASSFAGSGLRFFQTTDGNISCGMVKGQKKKRHKRSRLPGGARCDIKNHTCVAPPKPKYCDVDWGFGTEVGDKGFGRYVCAGDTVALPNAPVLPLGGSITLGRFTCTVPNVSVRCSNNRTSHGFDISAEAVSLF